MASSLRRTAHRVLRAALPGAVFWRISAARRTVGLLSDPHQTVSYSPSAKRKGRFRIALDHAWWVLRRGEVYETYFMLGQDLEGAERPTGYHSGSFQIRAITRSIEARGEDDLRELMKDKARFADVAEELGYPSPRNLAVLTPTGVRRPPGAAEAPYESLAGWDGLDGFCKPVRGRFGGGAFALAVEDGHISIDGRSVTPTEVQAEVLEDSLVQGRIVQREEVSALYPHSINTVRLVTERRDGRVRPLSAALRLGVNGSIVDNWSAGGVIVGVDLDTGRLAERGVFKSGYQPGDRMDATHHPDTGVAFGGYELPDFAEARDLVCRFHGDLGGLLTVGWDIALTPDGPLVVEGNSHWDGLMQTAANPSFRDEYRRLIEGL